MSTIFINKINMIDGQQEDYQLIYAGKHAVAVLTLSVSPADHEPLLFVRQLAIEALSELISELRRDAIVDGTSVAPKMGYNT
jgi:hypothetical protein